MHIHVSRRALLRTAAIGAASLAAGMPVAASGAPVRGGQLLAVAGLGFGLTGQGVVYGYRILAPAGTYRSAADGTTPVATVLGQLRGIKIMVTNGVTAELDRSLTAIAGGTWTVANPATSTTPPAGMEVIAFLPRRSLGSPPTIAGEPTAVRHIYALPYRYA
ncbi:hypothetical protein AB0B31_33305 [Catellatospora citrea]|uniref:hypothetical protein n=1 Tax=Catellatospora citrea TaxID=53366 RepID=UPI0033F97D38